MARKGRKKKRAGKFKILNLLPREGIEGGKPQEQPPINAKEGEEDDGISTDTTPTSISLVLRRSKCEQCGKEGELSVVTDCRGTRSNCQGCNKNNSNEKKREIQLKTKLIGTLLRMSNTQPTISKQPKWKSIRQEIMGSAAQRREDQMNEVLGILDALEQTKKRKNIEAEGAPQPNNGPKESDIRPQRR